MVEEKQKVHLSEQDRKSFLNLLVEEVTQFQPELSRPLRTNAEWANFLGISPATVGKIFKKSGLTDVLAHRAHLQHIRSGNISGKKAVEEGFGMFSENPNTRQPYREEGASLGGKATAEQGVGVHGRDPETGEVFHAIYGRLGGASTAQQGLGIHARTREQMIQHGKLAAERGIGVHGRDTETGELYRVIGGRRGARLGGLATRDLGVGIHARTPEQMSEHGRMGGRTTLEQGLGIHGLTQEERVQSAIASSETLGSRKVLFGDNYFDSYVEASAAVMMQGYIPGFQIRRGETYQLHNNLHKKIDFFVNGVFVEYNPILLFKTRGDLGSFATMEAYEAFRTNLANLSEDHQQDYRDQVIDALTERYFQERRQALDEYPEYQDIELLVVRSPEELFDLVITRFGRDFPNRETFIAIFNNTTRRVKQENAVRRRAE